VTRALFVLCLATLAWTWFGYALAMRLRARWAPRAIDAADWLPMIDIVVVAHDAARELEARLANLDALDYPRDRLRLHVASDGSEDGTAQVLRECADPRLHAHLFPRRRGKSACLGDVLPQLTGEIVVFTDVRQRIEPGALRALVRPLADPSVGAVGGALRFEAGADAAGVGAYWRHESALRAAEGATGSVVGVSGALYAARRALLPAVPAGLILDDLWIPLAIARDGARIAWAADAIAWDRPSADAALEARRKRRTLAGNFQLIAHHPSLLLPWKHPLGWRLWGHKWLRLAGPWLLGLLLLLNARLAVDGPRWRVLLVLHLAFYALALAPLAWPALARRRPLRLACTFVRMNGYVVLGLLDFLRGGATHLWNVTREADAA
jgi:cellulose synthase/poly-beta-1,6-N-acetylglucosamine synthase-like glycosyltransferase